MKTLSVLSLFLMSSAAFAQTPAQEEKYACTLSYAVPSQGIEFAHFDFEMTPTATEVKCDKEGECSTDAVGPAYEGTIPGTPVEFSIFAYRTTFAGKQPLRYQGYQFSLTAGVKKDGKYPDDALSGATIIDPRPVSVVFGAMGSGKDSSWFIAACEPVKADDQKNNQ